MRNPKLAQWKVRVPLETPATAPRADTLWAIGRANNAGALGMPQQPTYASPTPLAPDLVRRRAPRRIV